MRYETGYALTKNAVFIPKFTHKNKNTAVGRFWKEGATSAISITVLTQENQRGQWRIARFFPPFKWFKVTLFSKGRAFHPPEISVQKQCPVPKTMSLAVHLFERVGINNTKDFKCKKSFSGS